MGNSRGIDRDEIMLLPERLDDYVSHDNPVRVLDAWVDKLDLPALGFSVKEKWSVGRPGFDEGSLLKLLIYGYLNRIRSSRRLETETRRNLEVIWLTCKRQPDHWTINNFRTRNRKAFKETLRQFHFVCFKLELFGRELIGIDGTFFKASNSKARNFTQAKIDAKTAKVDKAIEAYDQALEEAEKREQPASKAGPSPSEDTPQGRNEIEADREQQAGGEPEEPKAEQSDDSAAPASKVELEAKLAGLKERRAKLEALKEQAQQSESGQVSLVDPDSRLLTKGGKSLVGHNVQMSIDNKAHLIVETMIVQAGNDMQQLHPMAEVSCKLLGVDPGSDAIDVLADGGYGNYQQIAECEHDGMRVHVPEAEKREAGNGEYPLESFTYIPASDSYTCAQNKQLTRHSDTIQRGTNYRVYYNSKACRDCPVREQCTAGAYRKLKVNEYSEEIERVAERMAAEPEKYAQRKGLAEHPFGTIKSIWGYGEFLLRGREGCEAELSLMALSYNWKRVLAEVGVERMLEVIGGLSARPPFGSWDATVALAGAWKKVRKIVRRASGTLIEIFGRQRNENWPSQLAPIQPIWSSASAN